MLRDIAVFLILYLVFRLIRNVFNPVKVATHNFQSQSSSNYSRKEEGRVEVKDIPNPKSTSHHRDQDGEYIDYKEIRNS